MPRWLLLLLFELALLAPTAGGAATQQVPAADSSPGLRALFTAEPPLAVTLAADFKQVFKDRDTAKVEWTAATLRWTAGDSMASLPVVLTTRGLFRLRTCSTPPLRIRFPDQGKKGTPWAGQGTLKLVTHCRGDYDQQVLQEYLAYKTYNLLTDLSLQARLARVTYVDQRPGGKEETHWGFFIEDVDDLARRLGGKEMGERGVTFELADSTQAAVMSVFLYLIGNTDWSLPYQHNVKVIERRLIYLPVPYDFDWSGVVDAPYAKPDYRLGTQSVRERVWRGPCLSAPLLETTLALFEARKDTIYAAYRSQDGVEPKRLKESLSYLDEFYDLIRDRRTAHRALRAVCDR